MLYVFHVDTGTMMMCDMNLALGSVYQLKEYVERTCNIPCDKQVLLVSGGESLDPDSRVAAYSAGTDTNPIFLFSKSIIESTTPPSNSVEYASDKDFLEKVRDAITDLPADYTTVAHRTQLAQQFYERAREQMRVCKGLVHDQHLQQQGWAAVVANLDDITSEFKRRADLCDKQFSDYMKEREEYVIFLQSSFRQDLQILSRIPLLPVLSENEDFLDDTISGESSTKDESSEDVEPSKKNLTLLEWISASDNKNSMDQLFEMCSRGLQQFDQSVYNSISSEIKTALGDANKPEMKEVKGIGDRLFGLDQLMHEAKRCVQEQGDLAQSLLQNQNRAGHLGDRSVLPDLCASHRKQLRVMLSNHQQLNDIRRRCTKAKDELIVNLYYRLKWVMYVENAILETSHKLFICHENLKRLRKHLEVLQQIHLAPAIYLTAITEVIRRKTFSRAFLVWASELACHLLTIYNNEVSKRKEFQSQFKDHFLNSLFPGLEDLPPTFATEAPPVFDSKLPAITSEDVRMLREALPEMAENLAIPDMSAILKFFESKLDKLDKETMVGEELAQEIENMRLSENAENILLKAVENESCVIAHSLPHLKDFEKGCESETDTEEFEKVCQSPLDLHFDKEIPSPRTKTQDVATLTEENLHATRTEYDKLKLILGRLAELVREALPNLKAELMSLRDVSLRGKDEVVNHYRCLTESLERLNLDDWTREREELTASKEDLQRTVEELKCLRNDNIRLEGELKTCMEENEGLRREIEELRGLRARDSDQITKDMGRFEEDRERTLRELRETLNREHTAELDNLRKRFKLMVVDHSPTDPSLERVGHIRADFESEKAHAIETAVTVERNRWEHVLKDTVAKITKEKEDEKQALRRENEEKENLLSALKSEISALSENESNMAASVGLYEGRVDVATSPIKFHDRLTKSQLSVLKSGKCRLNSCVTGDIVLVVWEPANENYKILQDSSTYYFLHSDCLEVLGLKRAGSEEPKSHCVGQVTDKQYCHARKAANRYKVPIGTKFYRVTVRPVNLETVKAVEASPKNPLYQQMSESQPAVLPSSRYRDESQESQELTTSQSTLSRSKSTMEGSIVTLQNEPTLASNRTQTFSYFLNDTWIGGSQWILENS